METYKIEGVEMTKAAAENVQEVGCSPRLDINDIMSGIHTQESLLAVCLEGAGDDRIQGWEDYVGAIIAAADKQKAEAVKG